jgi:hypothetical protein
MRLVAGAHGRFSRTKMVVCRIKIQEEAGLTPSVEDGAKHPQTSRMTGMISGRRLVLFWM